MTDRRTRYYSQSYELVEPEAAHSNNAGFDQYTPYNNAPGLEDTAYEPHRHVDTAYDSQPQLHPPPYHNTEYDPSHGNEGAARGPSPAYDDDYNSLKQRSAAKTSWWSRQTRKRKYIFIGSAIAFIVLIALIIGLAVGLTNDDFNYTPSFAHVTNETSFATGGATRARPQPDDDSDTEPQDVYTYYSGDSSNFPPSSEWISFEDMWSRNLNTFKTSCGYLDHGADNTDAMIQDIHDAIQDRANASFVDHRYILATILQESNGCPRVGHTTSSSGVRNPGLMQSHNGHAYDPSHSTMSIMQMIQDGTQGTEHGDGLVQNLNLYGDPYSAARGYNSGYIPKSGNLSEASGATACYVTDIANRLTGWVTADSTCPGDE